MDKGTELTILNAFAKLVPILRGHLEMTSWKVQNDTLSCLNELIRKRIKTNISELHHNYKRSY